MERFLLISVGAVLGANTRYWMSDWAARQWGSAFPVGTLLINVSGSFVLGAFLTLAADKLAVDPFWRLLFAVGFLGAYTTFSTYTFESINLFLKGHWALGALNLFGSAALGAVSVLAGVWLGKLLS